MTDPERISKRGAGLAAQLLQAGADEQPGEGGAQRTLVALGISGAILTSTSAVSAATGAKLTSAAAVSGAAGATATVGVVSAAALAKWIGIGVVAGIGLAGAAAVATGPSEPAHAVSSAARSAPRARPRPATPTASGSPRALDVAPAPEVSVALTPPTSLAHASAAPPPATAAELDVGAPLAAEVAVVDRGRSLLGAGRAVEALAALEGYEREFTEARLLPEVLFLRLEAYNRLGQSREARRVAQRLVKGFPKSPHAARARKLLTE